MDEERAGWYAVLGWVNKSIFGPDGGVMLTPRGSGDDEQDYARAAACRAWSDPKFMEGTAGEFVFVHWAYNC